ncbi:MAG: endonuclease [Bacteroidales bacterium]|nr:endonuclease [Bacteroidales bacterium]
MRISIFLILVLILHFHVTAQPPQGYYNEAAGLTGTDLQEALHEIIKDHQVQTYGSLYDHFESTDRKPNLSVWDMYSDVPGGTPPYSFYYNSGDECGNYNGEGQCYNREHSFPQSWFGGSVLPMHTDLFHLYPTDGYVNNRRSNYPFGEVSNATWTSQNGSKVGNNASPGYNGLVFEPIDAYKGDFARSCFYMSVRYYEQDNSWPGSNMTNGSQLKPWALALMMEWHENDPVSAKETSRNNAIYTIQENRNPFIDHPEYIEAIWGDPSGIIAQDKNTTLSVYPIPVVDYCQFVFSYPIEGNISVDVYNQLGQQINSTYSFAEGTITLETANLPKGFYLVTIGLDSQSPLFVKILK